MTEKNKYSSIAKYNNNMNEVPFTNFSPTEQNIFIAICSSIKEQGLKDITLTFHEIRDLICLKYYRKQEFIDMLTNIYDNLLRITMQIDTVDTTTKFVLFNKYTINRAKDTITISVNEEFGYILNNLASNFTQFELREFVSLESSYSKECYRRLKQFKSTGVWIVSIERFRELVGVPTSYRMTDINRRVLTPVLKELSHCFEDLSIEKVKGNGRGRSVKKLIFKFKKENSDTRKSLEDLGILEESKDSDIPVEKVKQMVDEIAEVLEANPPEKYSIISEIKKKYYK